jgi:hypothetical protein
MRIFRNSEKHIKRACRESGREAYQMNSKHNSHYLPSSTGNRFFSNNKPEHYLTMPPTKQHKQTRNKDTFTFYVLTIVTEYRLYGAYAALLAFVKGF